MARGDDPCGPGAARATRADDLPRERLQALGPEALADVELVALLLGTGGAAGGARALAEALLARHGGLHGLAHAAAGELATTRGVGAARSAALAAAVEVGRRMAARRLRPGDPVTGPADVFRHFHARMRDAAHERFVAVLLDGRHRWLREVVVSQGTLTASLVHPREVFRPALREAAAALVLVHNHPSGDPTPSREDREVTLRLARAGEILGVRVLDHVVVAEHGWTSLREEGVLPAPGAVGDDSTPPAVRSMTGGPAWTRRTREVRMAKAGSSRISAARQGSPERRRSERTPFVVRVDYGTVDAFFSEFTADVNEGGLFIETDTPQSPGTAVVLQFRVPGADRPIKVRGRVVWTSEERASDVSGMGIEFENLDARAREQINAVVRRLRAGAA